MKYWDNMQNDEVCIISDVFCSCSVYMCKSCFNFINKSVTTDVTISMSPPSTPTSESSSGQSTSGVRVGGRGPQVSLPQGLE